ncbi:MAG: hypothetical protein U9N81_01675 [Bacillota bacterium]|nr:hypothetical protein [Bacillota bacterium]
MFSELEQKLTKIVITPYFDELAKKYKANDKIQKYLEDIQSDVLKRLKSFVEPEDDKNPLQFLRHIDRRDSRCGSKGGGLWKPYGR